MSIATFTVTNGDYTLFCFPDCDPENYDWRLDQYRERGTSVVQANIRKSESKTCILEIRIQNREPQPILAIVQRYEPDIFHVGTIIIPETQTLFIGAGERLWAYKLDQPQLLWADEADTGFWSWARHGNFVMMSAELELAAWDINGNKQWTTFIEPPWDYTVEGNIVHLDVMGDKSSFAIEIGPQHK